MSLVRHRSSFLGLLPLGAAHSRAPAATDVLGTSRRHFEAVFRGAASGIALVDLEGRPLAANPALERLLGYRAAELRRMVFIELIHLDDAERSRELLGELVAGRRDHYELEARCQRKDGTFVWSQLRVSLVRDGDRLPEFAIAIVEDVSERRRAEALAAGQAELLELIASGAPLVGVLARLTGLIEELSPGTLASVLLLDDDGRRLRHGAAPSLPASYTDAVDGVEIGPSVGSCGTAAYRGELVIVSDIETDPLWHDFCDLALAHGLRSCWSRPIVSDSDAVVGTFALYGRECRAPTVQELELVETAAQIAGIAIARLRALEKLAEAQARYRMLAEQLPLVTYRVELDREGAPTTYVSPQVEALLGWTPAEWVGDPQFWAKRLHPDDRERVEAEFARSCVAGEPFRSEYRLLARDGRELWVLDQGLVLAAAGELSIFQGFLFDISDQKEAEAALRASEAQLRQAQKLDAVGQLAGGIAHDFNNILTAIMASSGFLRAGLDADAPSRRHAEEIGAAAERAASLTRQLLAFSRRQVLEPRVLDLNAVVAETSEMLRRLLGEQVELALAPAPALGRVKADPSQLEQVLVNLAINARDALSGGGTITVMTANVELAEPRRTPQFVLPAGRYVALAVRDRGLGMDAGTCARALEPFFTTKPAGKGTGLGLSTVYGVAKQSGGYLTLESEPGAGTCVTLYLPRVEEPLEPRPASGTSGAAPRGSETVLLVEDDEIVLRLIEEALAGYGYRVLTAGSGKEALALCSQHRSEIALLLTDLVMPGIGGRALARSASDLCGKELVVLYMSGYTEEATFAPSVLEPGDAFLQKPFALEALARKVRETLDGEQAAAGTQTP